MSWYHLLPEAAAIQSTPAQFVLRNSGLYVPKCIQNTNWFVSHAAGTGWVEVSWTFGVQLFYGNLRIIFTGSDVKIPLLRRSPELRGRTSWVTLNGIPLCLCRGTSHSSSLLAPSAGTWSTGKSELASKGQGYTTGLAERKTTKRQKQVTLGDAVPFLSFICQTPPEQK